MSLSFRKWREMALTEYPVVSDKYYKKVYENIATDPQTGERTAIYTGKKELHISADISHAVWKYYQATGDEEFMKQWGDGFQCL